MANTHPGAYSGQDAYSGHLITHALRADGFDASEDGTGRGTPLVPVSYAVRTAQTTANGHGIAEEVAHTLDGANGQAIAFTQNQAGDVLTGEVMHYLGTNSNATGRNATNVAIAMSVQSSQSGVRLGDTHATFDSNNGSRRHNGVMLGMAVRRLTPRECERLQGFPDDYTKISEKTADGPRYKALGNSMAVPVMRWIGERIDMVEQISVPPPMAAALCEAVLS